MCQKHPGPRCASHLRGQIKSLTVTVEALRDKVTAGEPGFAERLVTEENALAEAHLAYDGTQTGQASLDELIKEAQTEHEMLALVQRAVEARAAYDASVTALAVAEETERLYQAGKLSERRRAGWEVERAENERLTAERNLTEPGRTRDPGPEWDAENGVTRETLPGGGLRRSHVLNGVRSFHTTDKDGYLHSFDGEPAEQLDGHQAWFRHGKPYRGGGLPNMVSDNGGYLRWDNENGTPTGPTLEDGSTAPAIVTAGKNRVRKHWRQDGKPSRENDLPTTEETIDGITAHRWEHPDGGLHRVGGPAQIEIDTNTGVRQYLWEQRLDGAPTGVRHREDGPAIIVEDANGTITKADYYFGGRKVTAETWAKKVEAKTGEKPQPHETN